MTEHPSKFNNRAGVVTGRFSNGNSAVLGRLESKHIMSLFSEAFERGFNDWDYDTVSGLRHRQ